MTSPRRLPAGTVFHVVMNAGSGADDKDDSRARLKRGFAAGGHQVHFHLIDKSDDIEATIAQAREACARDGGVLVAAGGDGTINASATALAGGGVPLAVVPMGTFNYFARDIGMPPDPLDAAAAIAGGTIQPMHLARLNGRPFLVNASLGLYVKLIKERERFGFRFGRSRIMAVLSGLITALRGHHTMGLDMTIDGRQRSLRSAMVFLGKNYLQLKTLDLDIAEGVASGRLGVILLRDTRLSTLLSLAWRALSRQIEATPKLDAFCAERLTITPHRATVEAVIDGEIVTVTSPLEIEVDKDALLVVRPRPADQQAEENSLAKAEG